MEQIQSFWYSWGSFIAFMVALLTSIGIFYDASRKEVEAIAWKMIGVLAIVLILPSVVLTLVRDLQVTLIAALMPLAFLGITAMVLAVLALLFYAAGVGVANLPRCANCGKPRDPSWPYCPYCQYDRPVAQPPTQPAYPPPPVAPAQPRPSVSIPSGSTMSLDAVKNETQAVSAPTPETRIINLKKKPTALAYLVVRSGVHQGKTFQLGESTSIGRKADLNDIVLDDDALSRQHARVRAEDGKYILTDLASSNGTFVQDAKTGDWKRIQQRQLVDGMTIKMGETILAFMQVKSDEEA